MGHRLQVRERMENFSKRNTETAEESKGEAGRVPSRFYALRSPREVAQGSFNSSSRNVSQQHTPT